LKNNTKEGLMINNPLMMVKHLGQSIWLDYIQRGLLTSGEFQKMIDVDGVCGVTSNPAILKEAIVEHHDYDDAIEAMEFQSASELYEKLAIEDLQRAADMLRPVYESTNGRDGFVSLEVSPHLAYDTELTINEARRLWSVLDRPNSLIKVPATVAGVAAIRHLIADGISVNATLLFSLHRYQEVAQAYLDGLEQRAEKGEPLGAVSSVASFFLSRIDTLVDSKLDAIPSSVMQEIPLRGQAAIASARLAYQLFKQIFSGERWQALEEAGASQQRLLWASTSTKDPDYRDVKYVEALIGPDTINTLPVKTLEAFRDHGKAESLLDTDLLLSHDVLVGLEKLGVDLQLLTTQLEDEGVQKFITAYDQLLENLEQHLHETVSQ
jgi:transaldolase